MQEGISDKSIILTISLHSMLDPSVIITYKLIPM